jgi:adenylate cyclase
MPTDSTDPHSAHVGGSSDIGQDGRVGGEPEERQDYSRDTPASCRGHWPLQRSGVLDWLINGTRQERFLDNIFGEFCRRLRADGIPVARAVMQLRILHPQWFGTRVLWRSGMNVTELQNIEYGITETDTYRNSPVAALHSGLGQVRKRLEEPCSDQDYPIYSELRAEGLTDYIAWPLDFTLGKRHIVSFATDRTGGFTEDELALLADVLPVLSLVVEVRFKNRFARRLLETYVGPHASEQILSGLITRGSGVTITAVVIICDLRGFTAISELWPRDDVIAMLNEYFEVISAPLERHGGEILKFIGDGLLAVFPLDRPTACADALVAVLEACQGMTALNERRGAGGLEPLGYGIGVNVGDVMYGNIGTSSRLDFTVIGPAVNTAARLEGLTKDLGRTVLFSGRFAAFLDDRSLRRLGSYPLRGLGEPLEVFGFPDEEEPHREIS